MFSQKKVTIISPRCFRFPGCSSASRAMPPAWRCERSAWNSGLFGLLLPLLSKRGAASASGAGGGRDFHLLRPTFSLLSNVTTYGFPRSSIVTPPLPLERGGDSSIIIIIIFWAGGEGLFFGSFPLLPFFGTPAKRKKEGKLS